MAIPGKNSQMQINCLCEMNRRLNLQLGRVRRSGVEAEVSRSRFEEQVLRKTGAEDRVPGAYLSYEITGVPTELDARSL